MIEERKLTDSEKEAKEGYLKRFKKKDRFKDSKGKLNSLSYAIATKYAKEGKKYPMKEEFIPEEILEGSTAKKTNEKLWKKIVAQVKSEDTGGTGSGKWSARKAQIAVARYKKQGGGYKGAKDSNNSLKKWSDQKWTTSSGKPSEGKRRYLPKAAWDSMTKSEKAQTNAAKAKAHKEGKQFSKQPKKVAAKAKNFREEVSSETTSNDIPIRTKAIMAKKKKEKDEKEPLKELTNVERKYLLALIAEAHKDLSGSSTAQ